MNRSEHTTTYGPAMRAPGSDGHLTELWTTAGMVETERPMPEIRGLEAERQAVIGEPAPMALFGFATGTFILGLALAGMWPMGALLGVVPALLLFAGVGQFTGGLFALARGSTFGATAFCSFGMGSIIVASFLWMEHAGVIPATTATLAMLGLALFCLAFIALALAIAALRANWVYFTTFALLVPGYALSAVTDVGGSPDVARVGGWFLVAAAICAFYAGAAVVINSQWRRAAFLLGPIH
jgi:succinate-acetate transporter protein